MRMLLSLGLVSVALVAPGLAQAQTVTVEATADEAVPPPPATQAPAPQPAPQPYVAVQPQPQPYGQPYPGPVYAQQPQPAPQPQTRERPIWGLIISGAVVLGVSWLVHAALISPLAGWSASADLQPEWEAFRITGVIPVVGPWIQMGVKPGSLSNDSWAGYLAVNGLLQAGGLTMLILGIALRETETYYARDGEPSFAILPSFGQDGVGLTAVGQF